MDFIDGFQKVTKFILNIIIVAAVLFGVYAAAQIVTDMKQKTKQKSIDALIQEEMQAYPLGDKTPQNKETNSAAESLDIAEIVSQCILQSVIEDNLFSDITMVNSSTFTATFNGKTDTFHLIGVADDGNAEIVKSILERLPKLTITYGARQTKDGVKQIYAWYPDDSDVMNMVNIQIVARGFCNTTYSGTGYSEAPNIKYQSVFLSAAKR